MSDVTFDKLLISGYVPEDDGAYPADIKCNIATAFLDLYSQFKGKLIHLREFRSRIVDMATTDEEIELSGLFDNLSSKDKIAFEEACKDLRLDLAKIGRDKFLLFSLPNVVRCARFLLGSNGRDVGSLYLAETNLSTDVIDYKDYLNECDDNSLIDLLIKCEGLKDWEANFAYSLDTRFREKGLTFGQRAKAIQIIRERF